MTTYERKGQAPRYDIHAENEWIIIESHILESIRGGVPFYGKHITYNGTVIELRPGYLWDGASIPRVFRGIVRKTRKTRERCLPHDASYELSGYGCFAGIPRARLRVDRQMYHDLREGGVSWLKAKAMYAAVRVGGWASWGKSRRS
jgi:hypothetical protein